MSARIAVDLTSAVPPYEQVRTQVSALVTAGELRPGDRLPTVRDLAADLGLAVGTVQRAYRELEAAGVVLSRRRVGTVVAPGVAAGRDGAGRDAATARARALVAELRAAGLTDGEILDVVRAALLSPGAASSAQPARSAQPRVTPTSTGSGTSSTP
ncbi:GntR family transcriptional regulator [Georgenia yuyongxinii]|uniref:GntR family transcriptional regulator n=1 Tax=Georgenia yuyongxinii TaxID=2589797 RepID=A0A552WM92_9MICO|nr:GntR family transcriptional regulator [Georgenia yuyongxinii]TRW43891.1 GntR family transcriptional regulator [Georgenia yuyongxinii]